MLQKDQSSPKNRYYLSIALYPICILAFAAIALLLFSENEPANSFWCRSELFAVRLVWFEALFSVGWFAGIVVPIYHLLKYRQQIGGGYLAITASVINAAMLSIIVLFISVFFPRSRFYDNLPVVIQIGIFLFCIVKVFLLKYAQSFQVDGLNIIPTNIKNPEQLLGMLTICEQQPVVIEKFSTSFRRVREKIKYSLPQAGKIASSEHYRKLAAAVEKLYDEIMDGEYDNISSDLLIIERNLVETIGDCKN